MQLALPFTFQPSYRAEDFMRSSSNRAAYDWVLSWPGWVALNLYGPKACGKTHLAHIWAKLAKAAFLSPSTIRKETDLSSPGLALVVDGMEQIGNQEAFFHLYNRMTSMGSSLLLISEKPLAQMEWAFPDLTSRMRALPAAQMEAPDDALLTAVLVKHFADRQIALDEEVIGYLTTRTERSFDGILALAAKVDDAALAAKRKITIPFLKTLSLEACVEPPKSLEAAS